MPGGSAINVNLWVKAEPFSHGALSIPPHPRLSAHNLRKIISYAKNKGNCYPNISYPVWKHIACNKLQLSEDIAWTYFETYLLLSGWSTEERIQWDTQLSGCSEAVQKESVRNHQSIDVLRFVLLLFIQQLHKISLRASLISGSEEWPMRARSPELEGGRSTPAGSKSLDEHGHLMFVLNNLKDMLEILVEPESYSQSGNTSEWMLSLEAVKALGFIMAGSIDGNSSDCSDSSEEGHIKQLHEIALMQQMHPKSGFKKLSRSFSYRSFHSWLRSALGQNPFGISSCIASGRRLSWPLGGEQGDVKPEGKRGKIATNAQFVPKESSKSNKIIIMSTVCKQTVARSGTTLEGSSVKVHRCHYSQVYLLDPLRSVNIEKCRHSTVVLGAVEIAVNVNACEHVTIIGVCRRISISGSSMCTIHVLTPTRPLVLGGNEALVFGPYHTFYPKLEQHMAKVGLTSELNLWDQPISIGPDLHESQESNQPWELMPPANFYPFTIPFSMEGSTDDIPGGLPMIYDEAVIAREKQIDSWQKMVKQAGLTRDQRKQFQGLVESRFQDWLAYTGYKRELDGLVVQPAPKQQ